MGRPYDFSHPDYNFVSTHCRSHNRDPEMLIMRTGHPFAEPSPSFAQRHPQNTDVVGVQKNHGDSSANAA
jgi:hypothetical protein